jgi:Arc/MetJ family transcription regulator
MFIHTGKCIERCMMRTNIVLDDNLVKEAIKLSGAKTKKELIHLALKEFVENKRRRNLLDLEGKIEFSDGYDYKQMREAR